MGLKGKTEQRAKQLCMRLKLPCYQEPDGTLSVGFYEVVHELINNNYFRSGAENDEDEFRGLVPKLNIPANEWPNPKSQPFESALRQERSASRDEVRPLQASSRPSSPRPASTF